MFGKLLGKILAAPFRIASLSSKLLDATMDEEPQDTVLDKLADTMEKEVKKIINGD